MYPKLSNFLNTYVWQAEDQTGKGNMENIYLSILGFNGLCSRHIALTKLILIERQNCQ